MLGERLLDSDTLHRHELTATGAKAFFKVREHVSRWLPLPADPATEAVERHPHLHSNAISISRYNYVGNIAVYVDLSIHKEKKKIAGGEEIKYLLYPFLPAYR